jgi:hypothetical protein
MLNVKANLTVNAVVWIASPDDDDERQSTEQVLTFLEPFLQAKQIPFVKFEPSSAVDLFKFFDLLEKRAKAGLRPIIHIDSHGGPTEGLYIAASDEFVPWQELADRLRPINIAAQNNICIVSAACFSMHTIMQLNFKAPTPFFVMFAPSHEVTFGFIEDRMFDFYEDAFISIDVMGAHERHLATKLQQFHCERLALKSLSGYMRDSCIGRGHQKRIRALMKQNLGPGKKFPNTRYFRRVTRRTALDLIKPDQQLIDRHAMPFLMGKTLSVGFDEILAFVRADAVRTNVLKRRMARARRRNRRIRYAERKSARARQRP